jgi:hypothetical protein
MTDPNPGRWAGVCAGGYFAGAAVYAGNVAVLAGSRDRGLLLVAAVAALCAACAAMGGLVLSGRRWAPRLAVVAAACLCTIHLIGLARLFLTPALDSAITRSLQWQLGTGFLFLWLGVLGSAFRLVRCAEQSLTRT